MGTSILAWFEKTERAERAVRALRKADFKQAQVGKAHVGGEGIAQWSKNELIGGGMGGFLGFFMGELSVFAVRDFVEAGGTGGGLLVPILTGVGLGLLGIPLGIWASWAVSKEQALEAEEETWAGKILVSIQVEIERKEEVRKLLLAQGAREVIEEG
jgi:hypothetical protein